MVNHILHCKAGVPTCCVQDMRQHIGRGVFSQPNGILTCFDHFLSIITQKLGPLGNTSHIRMKSCQRSQIVDKHYITTQVTGDCTSTLEYSWGELACGIVNCINLYAESNLRWDRKIKLSSTKSCISLQAANLINFNPFQQHPVQSQGKRPVLDPVHT